MLKHFETAFKEHPTLIVGAVVVGALLIFVMFRSKTATGGTYTASSNDAYNLQAAQINASLVEAQDAMSAQSNQTAAAVQANHDNNTTQIALANGANATALSGAQINASSLLSTQQIAQQTSLLQTATAAALSSQSTQFEAGLENEALQIQHQEHNADIAESLSAMINPNGGWTATSFQDFISTLGGGPLAAQEQPTNVPGQGSTTALAAPNTSAVTSHLSGINDVLAAITQKVAPGDPTAMAASH